MSDMNDCFLILGRGEALGTGKDRTAHRRIVTSLTLPPNHTLPDEASLYTKIVNGLISVPGTKIGRTPMDIIGIRVFLQQAGDIQKYRNVP
jgi:hypothetical protein